MIGLEEIKRVFNFLSKATEHYWTAKYKLVRAEQNYESQLALQISEGGIENKNDHTRLAGMIIHAPEITDTYQKAKRDEIEAKMNLELAKLEVEQIQSALAYLTVQAGTGMHTFHDKDAQQIYSQ